MCTGGLGVETKEKLQILFRWDEEGGPGRGVAPAITPRSLLPPSGIFLGGDVMSEEVNGNK